jgi:peptidoglycan-associated lipoprotein
MNSLEMRRRGGMRRIAKLAANPAMIALFASLAIAGCASKKNLNSAADLGLNGASAATPGSAQDFTVNIGDRIFFDTDSSSIRADAQQTLARQAQWLNKYSQYRIVIEGHADERGTREYNLALGARRAAATRDFLTAKGVAANRMKTISYGKERPVAVCDDISCWSQNRRAVTTLSGAGS